MTQNAERRRGWEDAGWECSWGKERIAEKRPIRTGLDAGYTRPLGAVERGGTLRLGRVEVVRPCKAPLVGVDRRFGRRLTWRTERWCGECRWEIARGCGGIDCDGGRIAQRRLPARLDGWLAICRLRVGCRRRFEQRRRQHLVEGSV